MSTEVDERARRSVARFNKMLNGLSAYARAITGNPKIEVKITSSSPFTDGHAIFYRPPLALGDELTHERELCDTRNSETGLLRCPACKTREEILVNIYHEIAHNAFGTFEKTSDAAKRDALTSAITEWGGKYEEQLKRKFSTAPASTTSSYQGLSTLISPFLPKLLNALEDVRVDKAMITARKGVRKMLEADTLSILREGVESSTGERFHWDQASLNGQMGMACYLASFGLTGWEKYLDSRVVEASRAKEVSALLAAVGEAKSVHEVYSLSFKVLAQLRELGFFLMPEDDQKDEDENESDADEGDTSGESDQSSEAPGDDGRDEADDENSSSGDSPDEDESEDGSADPEGDSQGNSAGESGGQEDSDGPVDGGRGGSSDEPLSEEEESGTEGGAQEKEEAVDNDSDSDDVSEGAEGDRGEDSEGGESNPSSTSDDRDAYPSDAGTSPDAGNEGDSDGSPDGSDEQEEDAHGGGSSELSESEESGRDGDESQSEVSGDPDDSESPESDIETGEDSSSDSGSGSEGSTDPVLHDEVSDREPTSGTDDVQPSEGSDVDSDEGGSPPQGGSADELEESKTPEVMDTGADEGLGGLQVDKPLGTPEQFSQEMSQIHEHHTDISDPVSESEESAIQTAIIQGLYFETPSVGVRGVTEHFDRDTGNAWTYLHLQKKMFSKPSLTDKIQLGISCDMEIPESILGPALLKSRRVFTDNKQADRRKNLHSGRVDKKVLGRRAWSDDTRLFTKKRLPGKKSYAVVIGIDISSSTWGLNLSLAKRAAAAQAELCARMGLDFAVYAHCATMRGGSTFELEIYHIKDFHEPWNGQIEERLSSLGADGGNVDGHTLEFYRKRLDEVQATNKVLLYYTDGKMPAANYEEELSVLRREIATCKRKGYTLLGVGIRTDSPIRHGLDTVQVDGDSDLKKVIDHLGRRLA